jgi:hypothetical protein
MTHKFSRARVLLTLTLGFVLVCSSVAFATTGTIDPLNEGKYKARFYDNTGFSDSGIINFGKFTTQSAYNVTVSDDYLRGFAWSERAGWIVLNCADTASGCSLTNGNFKVSNDRGTLSGYAWGENTGWINFGPFTNQSISQVAINSSGEFSGTLGSVGYAWSQNLGWIVFDCASSSSCVKSDWKAASTTGGGGNPPPPPPPQDPCVLNPSSCTPPPNDPCTVNPASCTPPPQDPCSLNPSSCLPPPPPDPCTTNPGSCNPPIDPCAGGSCTPPPIGPNNPPPGGGPIRGPQVIPGVTEGIKNIVRPITNPVNVIIDSLQTKTMVETTKVASTIGVTASVAVSLLAFLLANPLSIWELGLIIARLWSLLLVALGLKKRTRPWGVVYDSVTKQPLDPAYVVLYDMNGNEVATSITDMDGRYGFPVAAAGIYKVVANKTNYEFPSKKLAGRTGDELYGDLYFGETIEVLEDGSVIAKNIPLDPLAFDWNEFAKDDQHRLKFYKKRDVLFARVRDVLFWVGSGISIVAVILNPIGYNIAILGLSLLVYSLRVFGVHAQPKGSVSEQITDEPLPFSIVRVTSLATGQEIIHKVADKTGQYYCLLPNGDYNVIIDKKNLDETYTKVPVPASIPVNEGYLKHNFKV